MKKFLFAALSLLMMVGCSDDKLANGTDQPGNASEDNVPGVYVGVSFQMPGMGSSRSTTVTPPDSVGGASNDGVEVGKIYENNVNEVLLILARKADYGYIGAAKVQSDYIYKHTGTNSTSGNIGAYHANAKFDKSEIEKYYADSNFDKEIAVFVVVNPNGGLESYFASMNPAYGNTEWINQAWNVAASSGEGAIWSTANGGNFLMTNTRIAIREIPSKVEAWELFSTREKPFHLSEANNVEGTEFDVDNSAGVTGRGSVYVHRACARFDFKDGSPEGTPANTYPAIYLQNEDGTNDTSNPLIYVELERLSLVNMNNTFYYFERTSAEGLPLPENTIEVVDETNKIIGGICIPEMPWYTNVAAGNESGLFDPTGGNYVVDYWAQDKFDAIQNTFGGANNSYPFDKYFEYPLFENDKTINSNDLGSMSRWASSEISDILDNEKDNYHKDNYNSTADGDYHIWRYVTENVIPYSAYPYEYYQPNGLTTGIVFRAKIIGNKDLKVNKPDEELTNDERMRNNLIDALNSGDTGDSWHLPFIYMYAKKLYAGWADLCQAAVEGSLTFKMENGALTPDWNRTNSLYMAVFGQGVTGCTVIYDTEKKTYNVYLPKEVPDVSGNEAKVVFKDTQAPTPDEEGSIEPYDENGVDKNSAFYAWQQWDAAGRPANVDDNGDKYPVTAAFKKAVTEAGITIYQSSVEDGVGGYYCYYYYWNRHNDNNRDGVMGPMEFCTVRNNVYKLSVTNVSRLGHPRLDENDPDTPKPDNPDESSNVYITVDSKVIPWVVRVNDIQF